MPDSSYDLIVIGGGHAAIEAALIAARNGLSTVMLILNLDSIGFLACNPSIGGTAKGHLVREIDALGGEMGVQADKAMIQLRMLNVGKGAAVRSLRAQIDKALYHRNMKSVLENTKNLRLRQAEATEIVAEDGKVIGVKTRMGEFYRAPNVVVATGVYMRSLTIIGDIMTKSGPSGFSRSEHLSDSIEKLGHKLRRFKTGTPTRLDGRTIDYSKFQLQEGSPSYSFSALSKKVAYNLRPCYLGYTNPTTHQIIRENIHLAPMYSGLLKSTGTRYCPSIEDKIVKFPDRDRHQFFLEPEGLYTNEVYLQGISTSLPVDVQKRLVTSIEGLENVRIMRDAYAIEYDCIDPLTLKPNLESRLVDGLFFAGQVNGTSGYEEAAAQGLMAGINVIMRRRDMPPLVLGRHEAYIGVLIDDLVIKGTNEPYRMMTSRAEYRLNLRQDTADLRLTPIAAKLGIISKKRLRLLENKKAAIDALTDLSQKLTVPSKVANIILKDLGQPETLSGIRLRDLYKRNPSSQLLWEQVPELKDFSLEIIDLVKSNFLYEGYIARQEQSINETKKLEEIVIPEDLDYNGISGLRIEARQKLSALRPHTIGQAARISGVNPADINVLIMKLKFKNSDNR